MLYLHLWPTARVSEGLGLCLQTLPEEGPCPCYWASQTSISPPPGHLHTQGLSGVFLECSEPLLEAGVFSQSAPQLTYSEHFPTHIAPAPLCQSAMSASSDLAPSSLYGIPSRFTCLATCSPGPLCYAIYSTSSYSSHCSLKCVCRSSWSAFLPSPLTGHCSSSPRFTPNTERLLILLIKRHFACLPADVLINGLYQSAGYLCCYWIITISVTQYGNYAI